MKTFKFIALMPLRIVAVLTFVVCVPVLIGLDHLMWVLDKDSYIMSLLWGATQKNNHWWEREDYIVTVQRKKDIPVMQVAGPAFNQAFRCKNCKFAYRVGQGEEAICAAAEPHNNIVFWNGCCQVFKGNEPQYQPANENA